MRFLVVLTLILLVATVLSLPKNELIQGCKTFTGKLYKQLITNRPNENIVFSPITIQTILSLLASAATDENRAIVTQIRDAANLPRTEADRKKAFKNVFNSLNISDNDFKVSDATKMYFRHDYSVKPWYKDIARNTYNSEIETVRFDNPSTYETINQWISKKTNNKILNVVDANDISSNTRNVLISTLYLRGKWEKPFEQKNNIMKTFNAPNSNREVEMMTSSQTYDYYEDNMAQYLKLEMLREGGGAEMVFVLPKNQNDFSTLESKIDDILNHKSFTTSKVYVTLPKFSTTTNMKLKPILENLGVKRLFEWQADLEGLKYPGHPYIIITDVFQKAYIDVNEWGVTAASVGGATAIVDTPRDEPKVFTADHPFLYYVTVDKIVVFAGRVMEI